MSPADYPRAITSAIIATALVVAAFVLLDSPSVALLTGVVGGLIAAWLRWRWADMSIGAAFGLLIGASRPGAGPLDPRVGEVQASAVHFGIAFVLAAALTAAILAAAWWLAVRAVRRTAEQ